MEKIQHDLFKFIFRHLPVTTTIIASGTSSRSWRAIFLDRLDTIVDKEDLPTRLSSFKMPSAPDCHRSERRMCGSLAGPSAAFQ